jgi:hypothetical protein
MHTQLSPVEKLVTVANSLFDDGDLEVKVDGSPVTHVELVGQMVWMVCENGKRYPAEMVNLAEKLEQVTK